jgi:hypothetical protein
VDFDGPSNSLKVVQIFSTEGAFAALRNDGTVVTWGISDYGGNSSGVDFDGPSNSLKVTQIFSTASAFAALRSDGSVVTWGRSFYGGDSSGVDFDGPSNTLKVTKIFSNYTAFAALRNDGTVVTWGPSYLGGNSSGVDFDGPLNNLKVVSFANPFTDDRLVASGPLPVVGSTYSIEQLASDGNEGHRHTFSIKRTGDIASPGSARFATASDTALSGVDFLPFTRTIEFKAGEDAKEVYVDSLTDTRNETTERFKATISKINAKDSIGTASIFGTIFNLAPPSTYTIERQPSSDGKEGSRHTFLIKRQGGLSSPGRVRFSTSSGTATSSVDFKPYTAIRNFAVNQDKDTVYVDSIKDAINEPTEGFNVSIQTVRAQDKLDASTSSGKIFNVFAPTTYSIETLSSADRKSNALEGSRHYFRIKRSGNVAGAGSVRLNTSSGTAISGTDFLPYQKLIEFKPGETEKDVYVKSLIDSLNEGAENFRVTISKISARDSIGTASVLGTIRNGKQS